MSKIKIQYETRPCLISGHIKALAHRMTDRGVVVELENGDVREWTFDEVCFLDTKERFSNWCWDEIIKRKAKEFKND